MRRTLAVAAVVCIVTAGPCAAQSPFHLDPPREWALLGTGAALGIAGLVIVNGVEPLTVDQLNNLDVNDINSFDRNGMHPLRTDHSADLLALSTYFFPVAMFANDRLRDDWRTIGVMWVEGTALNLGLDGVVKGLVKRTRPYAYDEDTPLDKRTARSARLSFYSGHTTGAAMNCFFVASVFSPYLESHRARVLVWSGAVLVPGVVAFARVDSGNHFRTDVITGYAAGAAIGWLIPHMHRNPAERVSLYGASVLGDPGIGLGVSF